ncbi:MAG: DUF4962 domain-containing protein [Planctomycetota bacterium]|nr:DUF4962 domain-containing protein [Planctomycetota bacterium]
MSLSIGAEAARPYDRACDDNRCINYRPADGSRALLNPPRFSWPYLPGVYPGPDDALEPYDTTGFSVAPALFTLEVARTERFRPEDLLFKVERTPFNFYNALPVLPVGQPLFWRVAYLTEAGAHRAWSPTHGFTIEAHAATWDRARMLERTPPARPRLLAHLGSRDEIRRRGEANEDGREILAQAARWNELSSRSWWRNLPETDRLTRQAFIERHPDAGGNNFTNICDELAHLAFARVLNGQGGLDEIAAHAAKIASYPLGGLSGPEGAPGSFGADVAQLPEFLAVIYDLCHGAAKEADLAAIRAGIAWRLAFTHDNFACRCHGGRRVQGYSLALSGSSHPVESGMGMFSAAALLDGDPDLAPGDREKIERIYEYGLHWLTGVTNGFGTEESWNEGPGYGNSKMQWLLNAVCYYDLARPELRMGRNPALKAIGDFFLYTSPLGLRGAPYGNGASKRDYVLRNRMSGALRLAYLLEDGTFRRTWSQSLPALAALGRPGQAEAKMFWRPWLAFALAARGPSVRETDAPAGTRLFAHAGWLCASTKAPNDLEAFRDSAGMVVQARPVGGYQHAFYSDGSPQLWAFGEAINYGSGTTGNGEPFAYAAMSTNNVMVNGIGQRHLCHWDREHFRQRRVPAQIARFAAYRELSEGGVYALADLTNGFSAHAGPAGHWWGDQTGPYQDGPLPSVARALRHILFVRGRYFVFLDDYALAKGQPPAAFSWLWHVLQPGPVERLGAGRIRYAAGSTRVDLAHLHEPEDLALDDREGLQGALNPFTGEDYRAAVEKHCARGGGEALVMAHNFWFTAKKRAASRRFLTVVYPTRQEEPAPRIESAGPLAVRVAGPHGEDTIDFGGTLKAADLAIDAEALAEAADRTRRTGKGGA